MDVGFLVARILHIGLGVFWAGAMIFNAAFLTPSMRDAGPDAAKVSAGLMRRGFLNVMPIVAIITLISGLYLYWRMSGGFAIAYITSPMGLMYGLGGIAALIAFYPWSRHHAPFDAASCFSSASRHSGRPRDPRGGTQHGGGAPRSRCGCRSGCCVAAGCSDDCDGCGTVRLSHSCRVGFGSTLTQCATSQRRSESRPRSPPHRGISPRRHTTPQHTPRT